jgi:AraC-like DNA-binding protein
MKKPVIPISKVRNVIAGLLPAGHPSLEEVAKHLGVSPRTLQRQLAAEDLTHSDLLHQTRIAKACQLLAQRNVHISDIAREAGFATPSAFSRAFQSWTGKSPRAFRNGLYSRL